MVSGTRYYPMIPTRVWWDLRRAFARSLPDQVTAGYLAAVLGIQERAAKNIVPNLRRVGLIGEDNSPTERATLWRDDAHYAGVCAAMLAEVYPKELRDALPPPQPDRDGAASWFARVTKTGEAASAQMARLYALIASGDVADGVVEEKAPSGRPTRAPAPAKARVARATGRVQSTAATAGLRPEMPALPIPQINIQVHIDASASAEQIEQIFASMARHLYGREI